MTDDTADEAFRKLGELFASIPNRSYRKWHLRFENGQAIFERDKFDLLFEEILAETVEPDDGIVLGK